MESLDCNSMCFERARFKYACTLFGIRSPEFPVSNIA